MPNSLTREVRRARWALWWNRNDGYIYIVLFCICSAMAGAFTMALYDKAERVELTRQHGDDIARFRLSCRAVIDERDDRVRASTDAAAGAATAASSAAKAAAAVIESAPPAAPAVRATPSPDLGAAVRDANKQIEGAR